MSFAFFTLGGLQLWEDVFYYQKWRIQRNCITNKYRLLDAWDIRRRNGTYEQCREAFEYFNDVYQLSRQKGHLVVMIHGLAGTKNRFSGMINEMRSAGLNTMALNYPSTRKNIKATVKQIDLFLNNLEDINEISFITHGVGGIIIRELLNIESLWQFRIKLNRVIQINPPNRECRFWETIGKYSIFRWIFGPTLKEYDSKSLVKIPGFPKKLEFGILCTHNPIFDKIISIMPKSWQKIVPKKDDAFLTGVKDAINIKIWKTNSCASKKALSACISFIKRGDFGI